MNMHYLIWDVAFNVFKLSLEAREKFLKEYSFLQIITLSDGTIFKDGIVDYPKFRARVEHDSLDIVRYANDNFLTANKHVCDTYVHFESLIAYINNHLSYEERKQIYKDICEINFFDKSYNAWRVNLLKAFSDGLSLLDEDSRKVRESVVVEKFPVRKEMDEKDYLMMTLFALLSGGGIDKEEKKFFKNIDHHSFKKAVNREMLGHLRYLNRDIRLSPEEKEKILVICSTMVTCDGEISKKESVLFEFVMRELEVSNNSLQAVRQFSGMSIQDVLEGESCEVISLALYFSLNLASADNIIHDKEFQIIEKLIQLLYSNEGPNQSVMPFYLCRFIMLKHQILKTNKALLTLINSYIIDCGPSCLLDVLNVFELIESDQERIQDLRNYCMNYFGPSFNKKVKCSLNTLITMAIFVTRENSSESWQLKLRDKLKEFSLDLSEELVLNSLSYILDVVILDGHVELLEDDFFIEICCKKNISDEMIRREIFLSSYRNCDYIKISNFLNYASF